MSHQVPEYFRYVSEIKIDNPGSGYTSIPTITISGGGGTGATATATIFNGQIQAVNITNVGQDYTTSPTVTATGGGGANADLTAVLAFAAGTPAEYEEKSALGIKYTLPEFIQNDYNQFVTFIEKYYEYMDSDGNPSNLLLNKQYNDIDELNDAELNKRALELAENFPQILLTDRKSLLKNIKNIYESKGSDRSIKAYFKLLYNEEVEVYYPSKNILRASDGIWIQEKSVRANSGFNNYEVLNLNGRLADIKYYETIGSVTLLKTIPITIPRVEKIAYTSPQAYEVVIDLPAGVTDVPGPGSQATATATIVAGEITQIDVTFGGYGYVAAPDVEIYDTSGGYGARARAVVSNGEITSIVLVPADYVNKVTLTSGGMGYVSPPTVVFDSPPGEGVTATATATIAFGEVTGITITNPGSGYTSTPNITFEGGLGEFGAEAATAIAFRKGGNDYDPLTTTVTFNTESVRSFIVERDANSSTENIKAYLDRSLSSVTSGTYIGLNAGFSVGDVFAVNESGDDGTGYAVPGYFASDYTFTGGSNNAVIRVATVDIRGVPTSWSIINPGEGFKNAQTVITITSKKGKDLDVTLSTKYLYSYDGKYKDDRGKLSDVNRIQDNYKYQSYSYIIKSTISQNQWVKRFKDLMHPAGMEVFGDLIITNNVNYAPFIEITSDGLNLHEFKTEDIVISNDDTITIVVQWVKAYTDTSSASEISSFEVQKTLTDFAGASSEFDDDIYVEPDYLPEYYVGPGLSKNVGKVLIDNPVTSEIFAPAVNFARAFADEVANSTDSIVLALAISTSLSDATNAATDTFIISTEHNLSETAGATDDYAQEYIEEGVLPEGYIGGGIFKLVEKVLTDISTPSDLLERTVDFNRAFTEDNSVDDAFSINMTADLGNEIVVTDDFVYEVLQLVELDNAVVADDDFNIELSPALFCSNPAVVSEIPVINISKDVSDAVSSSDTVTITSQKPFTEIGNIADSGVITIQDYSDPTYFSEDYVGAGYNF